MPEHRTIMGIESSCDETAVAIVSCDRTIHANQIFSQIEQHRRHGGVVPEIAARAHLEKIHDLTQSALSRAGMTLQDIDAIAVTAGPGLIGGLIVGVGFADSLAQILEIPCIHINHLEGHALSIRLQCETPETAEFPYLMLLASGGHCQILIVRDVGNYEILGETIDDAAGETFDKAAHLLGLAYPGGPAIEQAAQQGDVEAIALPRPLCGKSGCDFSFSGLKSAFRRQVMREESLNSQKIADFAASLQAAVADIFIDRLTHACVCFRETYPEIDTIALALVGGVAANRMIRGQLEAFCRNHHAKLLCPPLSLCTDNAAMIAWAACERIHLDDTGAVMNHTIRPRWPLTDGSLSISHERLQ